MKQFGDNLKAKTIDLKSFMKTTFIIGALSILIGFISCKKDKEYDKIEPLEYFPAFPGSYWIYDNNDTLKVEGYEKYTYNSSFYTATDEYVTLVLPKLTLNGIFNQKDAFAYLKEYSLSKSSNSNYRDPAFIELLSLIEGAEFTISAPWQGSQMLGKTIKVDTSIFIGTKKYENVIVTIHFDYACVSITGRSPENCAFVKEYYAKNIGLIKRERRYHFDSTFVKDFQLIDYKINR